MAPQMIVVGEVMELMADQGADKREASLVQIAQDGELHLQVIAYVG